MIKINLLPVEKRKRERTPLPRFGLIVLDIGVIVSIAFYAAYLYLSILSVEKSIQQEREMKTHLEADVQKFEQLQGQVNQLTAQLRDITENTKRPVEWWRAMDAVWQVIHQNSRIWIDSLDILGGKESESKIKAYNPDFTGPPPPYVITMKCHCAGKELSSFTKFRMDLKRDPEVGKYFSDVNWDAQWTLTEASESTEQWSIEFDILLVGGRRSGLMDSTPVVMRD